MINLLPEGKSIGWMQAPPQWIFTHTVRFVGVVRVVIQDGEGFILIKKGKPLVYYFKHGRIELRGQRALDFFNSHQTIEFNLCKYTPEEFARALKRCEVEKIQPENKGGEEGTQVDAERGEKSVDDPRGISQRQQPPPVPPEKPEPVREIVRPLPEKTEPSREMTRQEIEKTEPAGGMAKPVIEKSEPVKEKIHTSVPAEPSSSGTAAPSVPQPAILEDPDIKIIGQIKKLNGIVAISVFSDDRNLLLMGDVEIEPLLKVARTMLATTNKITSHLDWGSFIHMTLQIPEANVIIAPYHENHLCILTTRTINIGHIRRILRDLQQDRDLDAGL